MNPLLQNSILTAINVVENDRAQRQSRWTDMFKNKQGYAVLTDTQGNVTKVKAVNRSWFTRVSESIKNSWNKIFRNASTASLVKPLNAMKQLYETKGNNVIFTEIQILYKNLYGTTYTKIPTPPQTPVIKTPRTNISTKDPNQGIDPKILQEGRDNLIPLKVPELDKDEFNIIPCPPSFSKTLGSTITEVKKKLKKVSAKQADVNNRIKDISKFTQLRANIAGQYKRNVEKLEKAVKKFLRTAWNNGINYEPNKIGKHEEDEGYSIFE